MTNQNEMTTVQEQWFGSTSEPEKDASQIVVRECACAFD